MILSADEDPEGIDSLGSHRWGAGMELEKHPWPPTFPPLGPAPRGDAEQLPGASVPGSRTPSSDGCQGTVPSTGLQRRIS